MKGSAKKELLRDILQQNLSERLDRQAGEGWDVCCRVSDLHVRCEV